MSSVDEGPIHKNVWTHVEMDCALHASVFLERSSKRDGQHVLSVDGNVWNHASKPVEMMYRTRTELKSTLLEFVLLGATSAFILTWAQWAVRWAFVWKRTQSHSTHPSFAGQRASTERTSPWNVAPSDNVTGKECLAKVGMISFASAAMTSTDPRVIYLAMLVASVCTKTVPVITRTLFF